MIERIMIADIGRITDSWDMVGATSEPSARHWLIASWLLYFALLVPASLLAYVDRAPELQLSYSRCLF
jgi:hypothetical protein